MKIKPSQQFGTLGKNDVKSFKYPEDPKVIGGVRSNDYPFLMYSAILLSRAKSLNEGHELNQKSIDLIKAVSEAAYLVLLALTDFTGK